MPPDCRSAIPAVVPEPCFRGAPMATAPVERASSHGGHGPLGRAEALGARAGPTLGARESRVALHRQIEIVDCTDDPTPPLVWCRLMQPPAVRAATQPATPDPQDPPPSGYRFTVLSPHPPDANNRKRPSKQNSENSYSGVMAAASPRLAFLPTPSALGGASGPALHARHPGGCRPHQAVVRTAPTKANPRGSPPTPPTSGPSRVLALRMLSLRPDRGGCHGHTRKTLRIACKGERKDPGGGPWTVSRPSRPVPRGVRGPAWLRAYAPVPPFGGDPSAARDHWGRGRPVSPRGGLPDARPGRRRWCRHRGGQGRGAGGPRRGWVLGF